MPCSKAFGLTPTDTKENSENLASATSVSRLQERQASRTTGVKVDGAATHPAGS